MVFATGTSEAAADKMRLTHEGYLGIGTATPVRQLSVQHSSHAFMRLESTDGGGGQYWDIVSLTDGAFKIENATLAPAINIEAGSTLLVGLGTATPNQTLTIEGRQSFKEQSAAGSDVAAYGQIWVKNDAPNNLYYTGDTGVDIQLTNATGIAAATTGKAIAMALVFG